jgi:ABC-type branched-subunit amino acid transport system ATPase component
VPISTNEELPISADGDNDAEAPLVIVDISAGYGGLPVIDGVGLKAHYGAVTAIVGPNGSGKSTLLKTIVGVLPALRGEVFLDGEDVSRVPQETRARRGLGYVPQEEEVFDSLTVRENLEIGGYSLRRREVGDRLAEVLAVFPVLKPNLSRPAGQLSGGERRMVAIGRALMPQPKLLLLDEPTANLAPIYTDLVLREQLPQLAGSGVAVVVVEQRARAVLAASQRAYVMVGGRIVREGLSSDLARGDDLANLFLGGDRDLPTDGSWPENGLAVSARRN